MVGVISQSLLIVIVNEKLFVKGPPPPPTIEPATVTLQTPTSAGKEADRVNRIVGVAVEDLYSVIPLGLEAATPFFK
jgi:hypothetical protein